MKRRWRRRAETRVRKGRERRAGEWAEKKTRIKEKH